MPLGVPFRDSGGFHGKPSTAPQSEIELTAKSTSRSLKNVKLSLQCSYKDSHIIIDVSSIMSDKIKIKAVDAAAFARWILINTERRKKRNGNSKTRSQAEKA